MNQITNANELATLRRALDKSVFKGGPPVWAEDARTRGRFRIVAVRFSRKRTGAVISGQQLSTGKWIPISGWESVP